MPHSKRRIVHINGYSFGSTANIASAISLCCKKRQYESFYVTTTVNEAIGRNFEGYLALTPTRFAHIRNRVASFLFDKEGFSNRGTTRKLLAYLDQIQPTLIHLHNVHGAYLNLPDLFAYAERHQIPIVWTLHDCWLATGRCCHFDANKCDRWKDGCHKCPHKEAFPRTVLDRSYKNWSKKHALVAKQHRLQLVTPSRWLAKVMEQSSITRPIRVIHNGIDLPAIGQVEDGDLAKKIRLASSGRKVLGFVFSAWTKEKGLDLASEFARKIDNSKYLVVVIGKPDDQRNPFPAKTLVLPVVKDRRELFAAYSEFSCLLNFTLQENYPTINLESLAAGTPVLTFDAGGSPETINDGVTGFIARTGDLADVLERLEETIALKANKEAFQLELNRLSAEKALSEYLDLYDDLAEGDFA